MKPFHKIGFAAYIMMAAIFTSCAGEDYTPVYFPPPEEAAAAPSVTTPASGRSCTLSFTSQLCVVIKGDNVDVGTSADSQLCTEVDAFPIHIQGTSVKLKGSEFPDIAVEGHGLPIPITINARGKDDGSANIGEGTVDPSGNITIKNFSLFIVALGAVGEVPGLTLTTGATDELPALASMSGSPADAAGAMTLVAGTVLGHTIDMADALLKGASLTAIFKGSITPDLSQCGGGGDRSIEVKRLYISKDGTQSETPLADGTLMEVSSGTYISSGPLDLGAGFESTAKFRVKNIGNKPLSIQIPARIGPFSIRSIDSLSRTLKAGQSFVIDVTFKPANTDLPGKIKMNLPVGPDQFELYGVALAKSGSGAVSIVDDDGNVSAPNVSDVKVGSLGVPANTEKHFFKCSTISCGDVKSFTGCMECKDPSIEACELLPVSTTGRPVSEVDPKCKLLEPDAAPMLVIDLKSAGGFEIAGQKQVLAIRNKGVTEMKVASISLEEMAGSKSKGQFMIPKGAVFIAKKFSDVQAKVTEALSGKEVAGTKFPFTLPPYQPGYNETTIYVVVTYDPSDLVGADGLPAGVGSEATDKAIVKVRTSTGDIVTTITGTTTIKQPPALELYFKTSTGTKQINDGGSFSMRGITPETLDLAVPLFLKASDTATNKLRITSISIDGADAASFAWLDTIDKISAVKPPAGKGMRCSIPTVDESTGTMTAESTDLRPVSLEPPGFEIAPGQFSKASMPLFGCVDFKNVEGTFKKRLYTAQLNVQAEEIDAGGLVVKNPDGSVRKTSLSAKMLAAINPRTGKLVVRITQTMAAILNDKFPAISSTSSRSDLAGDIASGKIKESDLEVVTGAMVIDPFDEMAIKATNGKDLASAPNDGVTAVFRAVDTHPVSMNYDDASLFDFANLAHDGLRPQGSRGIYEDYPNVPEDLRSNGWRIFTGTLSYPGPVAPPEKIPMMPAACEVVNPCDPEALKKFTEAGVGATGRGACAFFYATGGRFDSPAFHSKEEMPGGDLESLCNRVDQPQKLLDVNTGFASVDGRLTFEEVGFRFFGPTYFHNPNGPLGSKQPMDEIFHMSFTTGVIKPQKNENEPNLLPDTKINISKGEYKINLNDKSLSTIPICGDNRKNRIVSGKIVSSWRFLEDLLFKDEEATIPAGCPDEGNKFTGGSAYLKGRDMDPETGIITFVGAGKFSSSDNLTFAFKDIMMFLALRGWLCDPEGSEESFEGKKCFDSHFNTRDAMSQKSIVK